MLLNKYFYRKLIISKYIFYKPEKNDLLIFDRGGSENITELLGKKINYSILSTRFEELNLYIIFKLLINNIKSFGWKKLSFFNHLKEYIKFTKPKVIVSFVDNNPVFFNLKKYFPNIKFVCIQNGLSLNQMDIKIVKNINKIDTFFCFSKYFGQIYKKNLAKKFITIGSLKANNEKKNGRHSLSNKNIVFISQFKNFENMEFFNKFISHNKFYKAEIKVIPLIYNFCIKKNIKLIVCLRNKNSEIEKKFYRDILSVYTKKNKFKNLFFYSKIETNSSYKLLNRSHLITCIDSALGLESMGMGRKTIFFTLRSKFLKEKKLYFGWPKKFKSFGFCWINFYSEKKIYGLLNNIYKMNNFNWKKKLKKNNMTEIMHHDFKNNIFKNYITKVLT